MICSSFLQVTRERTSERRVIIYIYIYKSSLDRPDGCIITIIVERESETRVEPFCSWTSREIVNRVTSAHFTRTITCLSPDYDLFSSFLRRHSLYPLFQFLYPLFFSSSTRLLEGSRMGWSRGRDSSWWGMFNWIVWLFRWSMVIGTYLTGVN